MNWISEIIWPLLIGFLSVVFRKPIIDLLSRLVRIRYKDFEVEFNKIVRGESDERLQLDKRASYNQGELSDLAKMATIYHDMGKYNHAFQRIIQQC